MKVVQINAVYHISSTGRITDEMHQYLRQQGVESYVFCSGTHLPKENVFSIGNVIDHKLHALLTRISGKQAYWSTIPTLRLISKLKKIQPDTVILGNLHSNYINLPILFRYLNQSQPHVVWVLHDCWGYTGFCTHYTQNHCFKWQTECHDCQFIHGKKTSWFFDTSRQVFRDRCRFFSGLKNLTVLGVSDWTVSEAKKSVVFRNASRFYRVYNWIDHEVFCPRQSDLRQELGIKDEDFVILGVTQTWPKERLVPFKQLAERIPEKKIILIGKISERLPKNIIHIEHVADATKLAEYYSMADVYVNFSQEETFGKVSAEALSCGTPVIANNNTANPEIVGDCGYVIANNNVDECIAAIEEIEKNGKHYYSERCIERAVNLYSKEKNLRQYVEVLTNI